MVSGYDWAMTDPAEKSPLDERLFTVKELAKFLRVTPDHVYRSLKDWSHLQTRERGIIRFREAHVEQILQSWTKLPTPPETPKPRRNVGTLAQRRRLRGL